MDIGKYSFAACNHRWSIRCAWLLAHFEVSFHLYTFPLAPGEWVRITKTFVSMVQHLHWNFSYANPLKKQILLAFSRHQS